MAELNLGKKMLDRLRQAFGDVSNDSRSDAESGVGSAPSFSDNIYKAVIPGFLYKPPFGYPLYKDIPEIRRMAKVPHVVMVTNTICNEIAGLDWDIIKHSNYEDVVPDEIVEKTKEWFLNPNRNDESFEQIIRTLVRDILEIDAGVIVKVKNLKDELCEIFVRDGGTFTKNPDIYGVMPIEKAYYQYGWNIGARPMSFDRGEIVYFMVNPRSDSIYGLSNIEVLMNTLQLLTYGIDANLEYFTDNNIPKGVFKMINAQAGDIKSFKQAWSEQMKVKDSAGKWRKYFNKMPIINTDGAFERIAFSNVELEFIQQQEWFVKLVWACFGVTPSELGFTDDSNRATDMVQSSIFKRKLVRPLTQLLEYQFNRSLVNDLPWIKGKYENKVLFEFNKVDIQEELNKRQIIWGDLEKGLRTKNECRLDIEYSEVDGGDEFNNKISGSFEGFNPFNSSGSDEDNGDDLNESYDDDGVDFGLKSFELKHKYIKRTGSPGNYVYEYADGSTSKNPKKESDSGSNKEKVKKELDDLVKNFEDMTTSDLQGVVDALADKYDGDSDKMLEYVYDKKIARSNKEQAKLNELYGSDKKEYEAYKDNVKRIPELRIVAEDATTSDLQGVTMALANDLIGASFSDLSKSKDLRRISNEADNVLLDFANGEIELGEVKESIGELRKEYSLAKNANGGNDKISAADKMKFYDAAVEEILDGNTDVNKIVDNLGPLNKYADYDDEIIAGVVKEALSDEKKIAKKNPDASSLSNGKKKVKKESSFRDVLADPKGKEIVEAIEHIDDDTKDLRLVKIRDNLIKELQDKFNYSYKTSVKKKSFDLKYKYKKKVRHGDKWVYTYDDIKPRKIGSGTGFEDNKEKLIEKSMSYNASVKASDKAIIEKSMKAVLNKKDSFNVNQVNGKWNFERQRIHNSIRKSYFKDAKLAVSKEPKIIFMAGLPGSGKTFSVSQYYEHVKGTKLFKDKKTGENYLVLNSDDIKKELPGFENGAGSSFVHEESSYLNKQLVSKLMDKNVNIVIDGTMKTKSSSDKLLGKAKNKGYKSKLIYVDVSHDVSLDRAKSRYDRNGRYVPYNFIVGIGDGVDNTVAALRSNFDGFLHIDNNVKPVVIEREGI